VVIKNQGATAVMPGNDFWVDVYIDPDPVPTAVNQIWEDLADEGLAWGVTLPPGAPFDPGRSLTLSVGDGYYRPDESNFSGFLPPGIPIYAQVDSVNRDTSYGGVLEDHEITGGVYNNISGPVYPTPGDASLSTPDNKVWRYNLPPRH